MPAASRDRGVRSIVSRMCATRRSNEDGSRVSRPAAARSRPLALRGMPAHRRAASRKVLSVAALPHVVCGGGHNFGKRVSSARRSRPVAWSAGESSQPQLATPDRALAAGGMQLSCGDVERQPSPAQFGCTCVAVGCRAGAWGALNGAVAVARLLGRNC